MKIGDPKTPSGIEVNGVPLEEVVKEAEEKEKKNQINGEFHALVHTRGSLLYRAPRINGKDPTFGIRRKTKILTDDEIRREKGIAMKSTGSPYKDVLWLLSEGTTLDTHRIVVELSLPNTDDGRKKASNYLYLIRRYLPGHLEVDRSTTPFKVKLNEEHALKSYDQLCSIFSRNQKHEYDEKMRKKREGAKSPDKFATPVLSHEALIPVKEDIARLRDTVRENTGLISDLVKLINKLPREESVTHRLVVDLNFNFNFGKN